MTADNHPDRLVAIRAEDVSDALHIAERVQMQGFTADAIEDEGQWYTRITDLHGTDPEDAILELGWYFDSVGTIPDTRKADR